VLLDTITQTVTELVIAPIPTRDPYNPEFLWESILFEIAKQSRDQFSLGQVTGRAKDNNRDRSCGTIFFAHRLALLINGTLGCWIFTS
jgi:hypothetical protein